MSKTQEQLDEEMFRGMLDTVDDMFGRLFPLFPAKMPLFPAKMFCEAEEDIEDVVDEKEEEGDDQE